MGEKQTPLSDPALQARLRAIDRSYRHQWLGGCLKVAVGAVAGALGTVIVFLAIVAVAAAIVTH